MYSEINVVVKQIFFLCFNISIFVLLHGSPIYVLIVWAYGWIFLSVGVTDVCVATDDEGGNIKPVSQPKKGSQSDLYMRLGLLLGDNARHRSRSRSHHRSSHHSHDSISSLASLDAGTLASSNTSPVSTLTGLFTIIFFMYHQTFSSCTRFAPNRPKFLGPMMLVLMSSSPQ